MQLDKDKLLSLPESELTFFLALGHLFNELNVSTKLLYWSASATQVNKVQEDGQFSMIIMFIQLLAGKLKEGWRLFERYYFGAKLSKTYAPKLDSQAAEAINNLGRYFGKTNSANIIRNNFSFHYSPSDVSATLPKVKQELLAYLHGETTPNSLFQFSETILAEAILNLLDKEGIPTDFEKLVSEFLGVSLWFSQATDGIMGAIIDNNKNDLRKNGPEEIELSDLTGLTEIFIPWFTETDE